MGAPRETRRAWASQRKRLDLVPEGCRTSEVAKGKEARTGCHAEAVKEKEGDPEISAISETR